MPKPPKPRVAGQTDKDGNPIGKGRTIPRYTDGTPLQPGGNPKNRLSPTELARKNATDITLRRGTGRGSNPDLANISRKAQALGKVQGAAKKTGRDRSAASKKAWATRRARGGARGGG